MYVIPVITSDENLVSRIEAHAKTNSEESIQIVQIDNKEKAVEYLTIEMPEMTFLNFSDKKIDAFDLLETIMSDSWLLHAGIISLYDDFNDIRKLEDIRGANIIVDIAIEELDANLNKILSIIFKNRRILFQRGISSDIIKHISGSFKLNNDPLEVKCYVNLICNFLYNANKLDTKKKFNLQLAINEMLLNGIEHGNCQIDYNEKSHWLENNGTIDGLIKERMKDPEIAAKKVTFEYTINPSIANFFIGDEGEGFNWRETKDARQEENLFKLHGRGILMTKNVVQNMQYNDKGNEVTFEIEYQTEDPIITPGLFKNLNQKEIKAGEIIFSKGEPSNFLYYIVTRP